jgi:hypothetical protein
VKRSTGRSVFQLSDDAVRRATLWIRARQGRARLAQLGREVFAVDFEDPASVDRFRNVVDELERRGVISLRQAHEGVLVSCRQA